MPYATHQQAIERYGQDTILQLTDRDENGEIDTAVLDQALIDASAEIDAYVAAKYQLPLPSVPDVLVRPCIDIAVYRLAADADLGTDERRQRYEDAVELLERLAKGITSLGLPTPPPSSHGTVMFTTQPRRFGRNNRIRGL